MKKPCSISVTRGLLAVLLGSILCCPAFGRPRKTALVDELCARIRREFVEAAPRYFSGPAPWVEVETPTLTTTAGAGANVYSEGSQVAWVVLTLSEPGDGWFETVQYFFDETGLIRKRERILEHVSANVRIDEETYFDQGRIIKHKFRHGALSGRALRSSSGENWDELYDPQVPEYASTRDLPDLFSATEWKNLAHLKHSPFLYGLY